MINADGRIGDAENTDEFKAESRLECGKAFLRIAACPDISSPVMYADVHLVSGLIEDVEGSVKKLFAKHLYKCLITRKTGVTLPWRFAAFFALAANDADRDFAAQVLLLLKQTVGFVRTMSAGLLPQEQSLLRICYRSAFFLWLCICWLTIPNSSTPRLQTPIDPPSQRKPMDPS